MSCADQSKIKTALISRPGTVRKTKNDSGKTRCAYTYSVLLATDLLRRCRKIAIEEFLP